MSRARSRPTWPTFFAKLDISSRAELRRAAMIGQLADVPPPPAAGWAGQEENTMTAARRGSGVILAARPSPCIWAGRPLAGVELTVGKGADPSTSARRGPLTTVLAVLLAWAATAAGPHPPDRPLVALCRSTAIAVSLNGPS